MTCSALEFQGPEQILFKVTLEQWEQQVLSITGWETPRGLVAASLELSSAKGLLEPVYIMDCTFLKLLDAFSHLLEDFL